MMRPAWTIARFTVLEAVRNRLLWLLALGAIGAIGATGFVGQLALTESRQLQLALLAPALRLGAVFLVATFVVGSMVREANDKGQELLLALPMPRAAYLFGKLLGFGLLAVPPVLAAGGLVLIFAPPAQVALWSISLLCELWIVASFSLFCALSLSQMLPALAAAAAFYLLARMAATLQLMARADQPWMRGAIDALAALLPRLDAFTRTEWLVYQTGSLHELGLVLGQAAVYLALMGAAALFDLSRKNL